MQQICPLNDDISPNKGNAFSIRPAFQSAIYRSLLIGSTAVYSGSKICFGDFTKQNQTQQRRFGALMIRCVASQAIRGMIKGLPLKKWFIMQSNTVIGMSNQSKKVTNNILIVRSVILSLCALYLLNRL